MLVGSWTEAQEKVILATLDTSTAMAKADPDALDALLQDISLSSHDMLNFLEELSRNAQSEREDEEEDEVEDQAGMEQMELLPYEHYDYVLILARNINDWNYLQEFCGLKRVNSCPIQGKKKIGLGRAIEGAEFIRRLQHAIQGGSAQPAARDSDQSDTGVDPEGDDLR